MKGYELHMEFAIFPKSGLVQIDGKACQVLYECKMYSTSVQTRTGTCVGKNNLIHAADAKCRHQR